MHESATRAVVITAALAANVRAMLTADPAVGPATRGVCEQLRDRLELERARPSFRAMSDLDLLVLGEQLEAELARRRVGSPTHPPGQSGPAQEQAAGPGAFNP